ncbi:transposase [Ahniella affigens]|uniref:transposase n=1 Tax=Ahniella affigens TaxID=2021234 RepID=UPI0011B28C79|nr:transposase [Ahniella affigens]
MGLKVQDGLVQTLPSSFSHTMHHLVDAQDLRGFDLHDRNDLTGTTAHSPSMLFKAVLLVYSQGLVSSFAIEPACRDNALFFAITDDAKLD